jgi:hypothetical protein
VLSSIVKKLPLAFVTLAWLASLAAPASPSARDAEPPRGLGVWDDLAYGHHRAVVRVEATADAVLAHVPWRRPDHDPETKEVVVIDAATGVRISNVARAALTREAGDIVFQPQTAPGDYFVYYLPFLVTGRTNYPKVEYPGPVDRADREWLQRNRLTRDDIATGAWQGLPRAPVLAIQSSSSLDAFTSMEVIATQEEKATLLAQHAREPFLLFAEDREHAIRMSADLPQRWIARGAFSPLELAVRPGEFVSFQVGLYAVDRDLEGVTLETGDVRGPDGRVLVPASAIHSFATRGVDWRGQDFRRPLLVPKGKVQALWIGVPIPKRAAPDSYQALVTVVARDVPPRAAPIVLRVGGAPLASGGDDEPERLSRL